MAGERKPEAVVHGQGLALDIAHYNYTLRFRSCGLSRGEPRAKSDPLFAISAYGLHP